jgi:AcrR family transcriptional regulator
LRAEAGRRTMRIDVRREFRMTAAAPLPARQTRSLRTQERILAATEALLAEQDIDALTIEAIAERAHVSIGAFYKRFRGKSSLLPLLLDRVQTQQIERMLALLATPEAQAASLRQRIDLLLDRFAHAQRERRTLFRALVVGAMNDLATMEAQHPRARELLLHVHGWLAECADEVRHPQPAIALRIGLFTALQTLQTAILFDRLPPDLPLPTFTGEIARMWCAYLEVE